MERAGAQVTVVSDDREVRAAEWSGERGVRKRREPVWRLSGTWKWRSLVVRVGRVGMGEGFTEGACVSTAYIRWMGATCCSSPLWGSFRKWRRSLGHSVAVWAVLRVAQSPPYRWLVIVVVDGSIGYRLLGYGLM